MPQYQYKGRNQRGEIVKGYTEAESVEQLKVNLRKNGIWVTQAKLKTKDMGELSLFKKETIPNAELILFTKQMGVMLNSGIPLLRALETYLDNASAEAKPVIVKMVEQIKSGKTYAQVLASFPKIFSPFYVGMIEIGETGSLLGEMHQKILVYLEQGASLKGKILFAAIYPCMVLGATAVGVGIILVFAFPRVANIYIKNKMTLPLITQLLLNISNFLAHYWLVLFGLIGIILLLTFGLKVHQRPPLKGWLDRLVFKIPFYRKLYQQLLLYRFTYNLALLLNSGISLVKAIGVIRNMISNQVMDGYLEELTISIQKGGGMSGYLQQNKFFPPLFVSMVRTGEESGELSKMIHDIGAFYETEVGRALDRFIVILEPVLIICAAGIVAFVLLAFYLPMFQMFQSPHF